MVALPWEAGKGEETHVSWLLFQKCWNLTAHRWMPRFNSEAQTVAGVIHSTRHNQDHRERAPVLAPRLASPLLGIVSHCLSRRIWDYISHELLLALPFFQLENLQDRKPRVLDLTVWTTCTVFWWNEAPFYNSQEEKD